MGITWRLLSLCLLVHGVCSEEANATMTAPGGPTNPTTSTTLGDTVTEPKQTPTTTQSPTSTQPPTANMRRETTAPIMDKPTTAHTQPPTATTTKSSPQPSSDTDAKTTNGPSSAGPHIVTSEAAKAAETGAAPPTKVPDKQTGASHGVGTTDGSSVSPVAPVTEQQSAAHTATPTEISNTDESIQEDVATNTPTTRGSTEPPRNTEPKTTVATSKASTALPPASDIPSFTTPSTTAAAATTAASAATATATATATRELQTETFQYSLNSGDERNKDKDLLEVCKRLMVNLQNGTCVLVFQRLNSKVRFDQVEINGKVTTKLAAQYYEDITKVEKPADNKTLIAILASCGALLVMIAILTICASQHRKPYNETQQHLTEELHTVENGYHDNPTLEVMEVQPEMQEKKVALNGEFNDSWIVPIDNLLKEDVLDEEDTHL